MSAVTSIRQRTAAWAVALFVGLVLCYGATSDRSGTSVDVASASLASWSIATTGDPWVEDVDLAGIGLERAGTDDVADLEQALFIGEAPNGHRVPHRSPGVIAAGVPAYVVAAAVGVDEFSFVPQALTAALLTASAMTLFFLLLAGPVGRPTAALATLVLALGTPLWSVAGSATWTHSVTVVGIVGLAWAARREAWWLAGTFGGVAVWGRAHTALIVAAVGLGLAWSRRSPRVALVIGGVSGGFLAAASIWTRWAYGSWSPLGGYRSRTVALGAGEDGWWATAVNHLGFWASPDRGLLVWTPLLLLLLPAVVRSWPRQPDWARWLALGGLGYLLVQGQLNVFHGGDAFWGYRLPLETLACVAPLYALAVPDAGRWARAALAPVIGLQVAAVSLGAVFDLGGMSQADAWRANAFVHALVEQPLVVATWTGLVVVVCYLAAGVLTGRAARPEPRRP
ncbi:hypothetical protein INN71_16160 [Nocardioides sp. ChNu-153]|uniref:hypothetical protein n=1 Tax=unclassified Nocardioides TaxID=2615069 RepID=UPI002405CB9F|nr:MULTISPECIES: hypothetical protein [unclassified Nocardioides]MDF9715926.1 hypothetical protein [Nocardioides sp. ChNu-99]MDN7122919.1 hypothetical protein [Nocardioides sp. ChNu-153]